MISSKMYISDYLENFRRVWKVSRESGKFPESLESFWTVLRVSSSVKSFRTVGKISRQSGKFPNILEKGWLAIAKLKPLSLFISLLSMPKKAFDNVNIEK